MSTDLARWQFATTSIYHFLFVPSPSAWLFWWRCSRPATTAIRTRSSNA